MKHRARPFAIVAGGILVVAAALLAGRLSQPGSPTAKPSYDAETPPALSAHLKQLSAASPGTLTEAGPETAGEAEFMQRAYPSDTITLAQAQSAQAAFAATKGRDFPRGKGRPGTWVTVGPSEALYPSSEFLNSFLYVPNAYIAGGRTTALAISSTCNPGACRLYAAVAGGGIWRTKNALNGQPHWEYLAGPLGINATGAVTIDPNDASGNTIYVGTGEANICGSGCVAGTGLYKSTDGGDTWSSALGTTEFSGKGIGQIVVKPGDPNTLYVGSTTALRGMSSVCCTGVTRPVPGITKWGLYKSTNGGASWSFIHNGSALAASCTGDLTEFNNGGVCSPRGVRAVALDPSNPDIVYAASYARGVWRSNDAGATWTQIKASLNSAIIQTRPTIAVTTLPNGKTRMYIYEGNTGANTSRLFRSDDVATGVPVFTNLTSSSQASPGWGTFNLCTAQCWYDQFVYSPKGYPDMVYVGGSYSYGQTVANKRGVVLSTDAGVSATDMTFDGTDELHPNGLHPDQHSLVTNPNNPFQFFESNDGGMMRSSGDLVDRSAFCDDPNRGLVNPISLARCKQMLSAIPSTLESLNHGLSTLQFQSLSVSPFNSNILQGGTQDNGTWQSTGNPVKWENKMIGDGGQSGFDVGVSEFRFHNFTGVTTDVNFNKGDIADWIWISDPVQDGSATEFYAPVISDPKVSGTLFSGTGKTVYRTKTFGFGSNSYAYMNQHCNEWTGDFTVVCGDWTQVGAVALTDASLGTRAGSAMTAIERTKADTSTAWAATSRGRVFVSKNADANPSSAVTWTRIDNPTTPDRYVSSIYVDANNGNHAWISYSGYDSNTPATPGHLFEVTYNPIAGTATWTNRSYNWGDLPANDVALDEATGDAYASSDFGVAMLPSGTTSWVLAAPGMPNVEVAGITMLSGERILYAATHGLGAWRLNLAK
jgi:hypothetical protein